METIDEHFVRRLREREDHGTGPGSTTTARTGARIRPRCDSSSTPRCRAGTSTSRRAGCRRRARATTRSARPATRATRRSGCCRGSTTRRCCTTAPAASTPLARAVAGSRQPGARRPARASRRRPSDPMSGGRHKVFGHPGLSIIPQTSTIGSHLPRAVGLALRPRPRPRRRASRLPGPRTPSWCAASATRRPTTRRPPVRSTPPRYLAHRGIPCPVLFVCEDNGIGISTRSPGGWPAAALAAPPRAVATGTSTAPIPTRCWRVVAESLAAVRESRRAAVLHLRTVRFMGHAGSDAEIAYRSRSEIRGRLRARPAARRRRSALLDARRHVRRRTSSTATSTSGATVMDRGQAGARRGPAGHRGTP